MTEFERKRLAAGMTQTAVAEKLGVDPSTVSRWEASEPCIPEPKHFPKIAKLFSMTAEEVVSLFDESAASSVK
jgi:transcriptional regulator with XRE-family HTH domain